MQRAGIANGNRAAEAFEQGRIGFDQTAGITDCPWRGPMEGTDHGKAKRRFRCGDLCRVELGYADAIVPRVAVGIRKGGVTARLRPEEWTNPFFSMSSSAPAAAIRSACSFVDWAISGA
ncbi:MAG: hypothetical protein ACYC0C_16855 [Devosia sp.]